VAARFDEIVRAVSAVPGVKSAALVSRIPIGAGGADCSVRAEGGSSAFGADMRTASPAYFKTLGLPMLFGRSFTAADRAGGPAVVVINRRLARALFGVENAVGRRVVSCGPIEPAEVVGVTGDIHADGLASGVSDQVYYASTQVVQRGMTLVVRGTVPVTTLTSSIRRAVNALDPLLPIGSPGTMEEIIRQTLATPRFQSGLLAVLSAAGLLLAVIGIYGVIALLVVQRTQEFAVRMALGAHRSQVMGLVMREGMALALLGIAAGVVASLFATRVVDGMLFGVEPRDPPTFAAAALLLAATALASNLVPAWRATRVDPLAAMRD
jgi:putative ABC transport system permease protein